MLGGIHHPTWGTRQGQLQASQIAQKQHQRKWQPHLWLERRLSRQLWIPWPLMAPWQLSYLREPGVGKNRLNRMIAMMFLRFHVEIGTLR